MRNKIATSAALVAALNFLITPIKTEARGGGWGGGGGRGGAYSGGRVMNRTPSMSRSSSRPAFSQAPRSSVSRDEFQQRPSAANHAELRDQVNRYAQNRPIQNIDHQAITQRSENFSRTRDTQIVQNRQFSERVGERVRYVHPNSRYWFNRNFFNRHNINVNYVRAGVNWWRPASWATLATWGAWHWLTPYYYDYGGDAFPVTVGNVYPITGDESSYPYLSYNITSQPYQQSNQVQPIPSAQTASTIVEEEWLPLGVFAVGSNALAAAQSNRFIQLALNRNGELAGVLYNSTTDAAYDLVGMVDPHTQKAYWSLANRADSPIASTGIYNLTEDQTPINVQFANGTTQTWSLVRLPEQ